MKRITGEMIRTAEKLCVDRHSATSARGDLVVTTYRFPHFPELLLILSTPAKGGVLTTRYCVGDDDRTTPEGAAEMLNALDRVARRFVKCSTCGETIEHGGVCRNCADLQREHQRDHDEDRKFGGHW